MLDQRSGMIEPSNEQARCPKAANNDASTLHRRSFRQTTSS
jgi:hypothetical protein